MTKHTFQQIRQEQRITTQQVAEAAGVSLGVAYTFEIGGVVPTATKQRILAAFSTLTGNETHLDDFEAPRMAVPSQATDVPQKEKPLARNAHGPTHS